MTFISTMKLHLKHQQTPRDIYYSNLEEAYGNLPVPSDDWADIKKLISDWSYLRKTKSKETAEGYAIEEIEKLEKAIEVIKEHYDLMAVILNKHQLYG